MRDLVLNDDSRIGRGRILSVILESFRLDRNFKVTVRRFNVDSQHPSVPSRVDLLETGMFIRTGKD
jgi:hypothetical protein